VGVVRSEKTLLRVTGCELRVKKTKVHSAMCKCAKCKTTKSAKFKYEKVLSAKVRKCGCAGIKRQETKYRSQEKCKSAKCVSEK